MRRAHAMPFGAHPGAGGVRFRIWAPGAARVDVEGTGTEGAAFEAAMTPTPDGWHEVTSPLAHPGTRYRYRIDGDLRIADPAARFNPGDVHGDSEVIDPLAFEWEDAAWTGRPWHEAVLYELHVGTFSPEGTFAGVTARLDHLVALGVTALELMPIGDFPGARNWGYDGVLPFAPDARYGTPADLKTLVAAAHARGLMVFLDVVYNHFGPEGNYLHRVAPAFFTERHHTPWGAGINFDGDGSRVVRDYFIHNALYWLEEYHMDGLRLDAVHAILDDSRPDFLSELAAAVRAGPGAARHVHLVLENDHNEARRLARDPAARPLAYTAQWNDDFHHVMHHLLTGDATGWYADYATAPLERLGRCLAEGFAYQGDHSAFRGGIARGEQSAALPPGAFVNFLQNHDQVGNRAFGDRLHDLVPDDALRGALAVLLLAPSPPLLFMGEEFGAGTPFQFFCDFGGELATAVREGRRAEFAHFAGFSDASTAHTIPDPGAPETASRSTLDWGRVHDAPHAGWLAFYQDLLRRRAAAIVPLVPHIVPGAARYELTNAGTLAVQWPLDDGRVLVLDVRIGDASTAPIPAAGPGRTTLWETASATPTGWSVRWSLGEAPPHG